MVEKASSNKKAVRTTKDEVAELGETFKGSVSSLENSIKKELKKDIKAAQKVIASAEKDLARVKKAAAAKAKAASQTVHSNVNNAASNAVEYVRVNKSALLVGASVAAIAAVVLAILAGKDRR